MSGPSVDNLGRAGVNVHLGRLRAEAVQVLRLAWALADLYSRVRQRR